MVHASAQIEAMLGLGDSINTRYRIAEAIMDCLEDLVAMKPMKVEEDQSARVTGTMQVGDQVFAVDVAVDPRIANSTEGMHEVDTPLEMARGDL